MVGGSLKLAFVLAALGSSVVAVDVLPRQTTFSNTTTPSTATGTASGIPTPPPCCWIAAGTHAVGLNLWYTSTAEHVVATVITTYIRENNGSAVPANSTTIYANTTGFPTAGNYGPSSTHPWVTVPGVPSTLLPEGFQFGLDYARSNIGNATAMTFPGTDLVIQQPTPYDEWFQLAIYTATPSMSQYPSSTGLTAWPPSMCGTYTTFYELDTITQTITSGGTPTTTLSYSTIGSDLWLVPSGKDGHFLHTAALFGGDTGVDQLNVTYIEPKATQVDSPRAKLDFPTGLLAWLAKQENIATKYPYITDCYLDEVGEGQPTVHVPVNALTVTSSHIIDVQKAPSPSTTSPSAVNPTESARTEIEGTSLDLPATPPSSETTLTSRPPIETTTATSRTEVGASPSDLPATSPSSETTTTSRPPIETTTATSRTEVEASPSDLPAPPPPSETTTTSRPPVETITATARTEIEGTSLDLPPPSSSTTSIIPPLSFTSIASFPHTEVGGSSLDLPPSPPASERTSSRTTQNTRFTAPGMTIHTEDRGPSQDVPASPQSSTNPPGSAIQAQTSDAAGGQESSGSRPSGVVVIGSDDDNDDASEQQPSPGNTSEDDRGQEPSQDGSGEDDQEQVTSPGNGGIGGLISAIQSAASQQAGASPVSTGASSGGSQGNNQQDAPARPEAVETDSSVSRANPAPSVTGFVVGSRTLTPGGAAITQQGSTISALPSGSGLQVIAQSETIRLDGVVPPGMFAVPGVVQRPDSEDEYLVGNNAVSAGGSAVTIEGSTFSALPGGSGVQVVNSGGQTRTESVVAVASMASSPVQSGEDDEDNYIFGSNTISAGGQALAIDGKTFSALPSLSGIVIASEGQASTVSVGGTVDFLTVTGGSFDAFATPVLLPGNNDDDGNDSGSAPPPQQTVTLGGSTYTALATEGSLLVIDSHTVKPGETTVINDKTVVLSGTKLIVAGATATSTHGLGDEIMNGLGGASPSSSSGNDQKEGTPSSSEPEAEETSTANDDGVSDATLAGDSRAASGAQVTLGCLVASALFALALM